MCLSTLRDEPVPTLQQLNNCQINEVLAEAARRQVPVTITVAVDASWATLHSRLLAVKTEHLFLAAPPPEAGVEQHEFAPADKVGVSFKLKHHKHIFSATVAGLEQLELADGTVSPVLKVCSPTRMQRLQRRAYIRAAVPANRIVRASFWLGGRKAEPAGTTPERPVWSGRVTDISAGGFQIEANPEAAAAMDVGECVGVRFVFGTSDEAVFADAQFRHIGQEGQVTRMGFQLVGLAQSREGQAALQLISARVAEFHRAAEKRR
ncbi:MAG: PilZ domain-containing protein [Planctomycetota bacterium]|nr:PilZ domain-containing protein [Planctomycetota bacterium]